MRLGVRERSRARAHATTRPKVGMGREIRQLPRRSLLQMERGGVPLGSMENTIQGLESSMDRAEAVVLVSLAWAEPPQRAPKVRSSPIARARSRPGVCGCVYGHCYLRVQ